MTQFQTFLIARNQSPSSKLQSAKIDETYSVIQLSDHTQQAFNNCDNKQAHYQNYSQTPAFQREQQQKMSNQFHIRNEDFNSENKEQTQNHPLLLNHQNLPQDYIRIIQDIEEKRTKSKSRLQPSQQPQTNVHSSQLQRNQIPLLQLSRFNQQGVDNGYQMQGVVPLDISTNYLDQLYQNQMMNQQRRPIAQTTSGAQTPSDFFGLHQPQSNIPSLNLLQYYQQKFNMIQQSQQKLVAQQHNLYNELQRTYHSTASQHQRNYPSFGGSPFSENYMHFQSQQFSQADFESPVKSNVKNLAESPLTPSPLKRQNLFKRINPELKPDDLVSYINKELLQDFESKPFSIIQSKYKQLNSVTNASLRKTSEFSAKSQFHFQDSYTIANDAALFVQKHLKGYIIRRRFVQFSKAYFFFKKYEMKVLIHDLINSMKESFIQVKNIKTQLLKDYVILCATKIQKVFKGFYARRVVVKIKKAFKVCEVKLKALVQGWRIRKIMKTKEIQTLVSQIRDYKRAMREIGQDASVSQRKSELLKGLEVSRINTVEKLKSMILKMQINGLWLMYKQLEKEKKESQEATKVIKIQRNRNATNSQLRASSSAQSGVKNLMKKQGGYLTIENDHNSSKSTLPKTIIQVESMSQSSKIQQRNKFLSSTVNQANLNPYHSDLNTQRDINTSSHSIEDYLPKTNINAYNDVPIKSFSRDSNPLAFGTMNLTSHNKFEPNFHSDAYKTQAKQSFRRRMDYNPRDAASKSRERGHSKAQAMESPIKSSPVKVYSSKIQQQYPSEIPSITNERNELRSTMTNIGKTEKSQYNFSIVNKQSVVASNKFFTPQQQQSNSKHKVFYSQEMSRRTREERKRKDSNEEPINLNIGKHAFKN